LPTDGVHPDQQPLIPAGHEVVECGGAAPPVLIGGTKSGSAPGWLQDAVSQKTGD
jgi:hypothetical protein